MFLNFSPQGFFMGTIMTLLCCGFLLFPHSVSRVFAQAFIISSDFVPLDFSMIIFIVHDVQVLKGECYNINICDQLTKELGITAAPATTDAVGVRRPPRPNRRILLLNRCFLSCIKGRSEKWKQ
jgi:hypothetical protein